MTRPTLRLARCAKQPDLARIKQAIRMWKGQGIAREVYKANVRKWLEVTERMGSRHILKGHPVSWGIPGEPGVRQVYAPRRMERA